MGFNLQTLAHLTPAPATLPNGAQNTPANLNAYARSTIRWQKNPSLQIGPIKIPEKVGILAAAVVTGGAAAGAFGGTGAAAGASYGGAGDFAAAAPGLSVSASETAGLTAPAIGASYGGAGDYASSVPGASVSNSATVAAAAGATLPPGAGTFAGKILDYALGRNLLNQASKGAGQADVSTTRSAPWKNPLAQNGATRAGSSIGAANSATWYVVLAVAAILFVFFLKGR